MVASGGVPARRIATTLFGGEDDVPSPHHGCASPMRPTQSIASLLCQLHGPRALVSFETRPKNFGGFEW